MRTSIKHMKIPLIIAAIAGTALIAQAVPTPIDGTISFSGSAAIDGSSFLTATQFLSFQDVFVGSPASVSGDYLGTSGSDVTVSPFIWSPTTASTPVTDLWSFDNGGNTYSYDLNALQVDYVASDGMVLSGLGVAHITGPGLDKQATAGSWNFSTQKQGLSTFTFSSSTTVPVGVPDGGATAAMLGGVLIGFRKIARRKSASKR